MDTKQDRSGPTVADVDAPTLAKFESLSDDQRRELYDSNRPTWRACMAALTRRNEGRLSGPGPL